MINSSKKQASRSAILNPHVLLLQTKLTSPNSYTGGRWAVFNPINRKAAVAVGKDRLPKLVALLTNLSSTDALVRDEEIHRISEAYYQSLVDFGIVIGSFEEVPPLPESEAKFIGRYHTAVHNFDWFDYRDPDWRRKDNYRMEQYHRQAPPPPNFTAVNGKTILLPQVDLEMPSSGLTPLGRVSGVLRWSLGPIGTVPGGAYTWLRRTSPSGGARHPTDAYLIHGGVLEGIAAGAYFYDSERHALVALPEVNVTGLGEHEVRLVITSHVERPMWRYRDTWSYRPIVVDAGHVLETASLLAGHFGLVAVSLPSPAGIPFTKHHLANIDMGALSLTFADVQGRECVEQGCYSRAAACAALDDSVITSPFVYFVFREGDLVARSATLPFEESTVGPEAFVLLSHCLPSTRGDRITTRAHLAERFPNVTLTILEDLQQKRILLARAEAHEAYGACWLWVEHGWYMSLLAHVEGLTLRSHVHALVPSTQLSKTTRDCLVSALRARKTCRTFSPRPVCFELLNETLKDALVNLVETTLLDNVAVYAWFNGETRSAESNAFLYAPEEHTLIHWGGKHVNREDIRRLAIGQAWAAASGATVLLRTRIRGPEDYIDAIMRLGRIGQRICISATAAGLGVFETPAVKEPVASELLGTAHSPIDSDIYYFLAVGHQAKIDGDDVAVS